MAFLLSLAQLVLAIQSITDAAVIPEVEDKSPGYYKLSAQVLRGSTFQDAKRGAEPYGLLKRSSDGTLSMSLNNENTFYLTEIEVGSTNQKVGVLVDTGSSDLWVVASNNTYCESGTTGSLSSKRIDRNSIVDRTNLNEDGSVKTDKIEQNKASSSSSSSSSSNMIDCSVYGTFDSSNSDTFQSNQTSFSITYADSTFAKGVWGMDNFVIGGTSVDGLSFAVCDNTDNQMGVLGIGLAGLETTYSGSGSSSYTYENLPIRLKSLGITNSVAYSVYLNETTSDDALVLFGAVDHNRYTGDLVSLPIVNSLASQGYNSPIELEVTLNSITVVNTSSNTEAQVASGAGAALLDTGTTLTYVPTSIMNSILSLLNAEYSSSIGYYVTQCSSGDSTQINFNFQGQTIEVPLSSFLVSLTTTSGATSKYCMVGILSSGTGSTDITLGDSFLRYAYMVADLENYVIALGQAAHGIQGENIDVISSSIPSAISASSSSTYGGSNTVMSAVSNASMTSVTGTTLGNTSTTTSGKGTTATTTSTSTTKGRGTTNKTTNTTGTTTSATVSSISSNTQKGGAAALDVNYGVGLAAFIAALI